MAAKIKRRVVASILHDAISDREGLQDLSIAEETEGYLKDYRDLLENIKNGKPITRDDHSVIAHACHHARIWRTSYLEAWAHTGDKEIIREAKEDIKRINRTEEKISVRVGFAYENAVKNAILVPITEIHKKNAGKSSESYRCLSR